MYIQVVTRFVGFRLVDRHCSVGNVRGQDRALVLVHVTPHRRTQEQTSTIVHSARSCTAYLGTLVSRGERLTIDLVFKFLKKKKDSFCI